MVRARTLACRYESHRTSTHSGHSIVRKDIELSSNLLKRSSAPQFKNSYSVEVCHDSQTFSFSKVVLEAVKFVDSKRQLKKLNASVEKLRVKKTKAVKRLINEKLSEAQKLREEGSLGSCLSGALINYLRTRTLFLASTF